MKNASLGLGMALCMAAPCYALDTVNIYGLIDIGVLYNSDAGGSSLYRLAPSNLQGNRIGFSGTENLGGGTSALFVLENGFSVNNGTLGQGGALFGRQAYVGLKGNVGSIMFGRQYDLLTNYVAGFTSAVSSYTGGMGQITSVYGAHPGDLDNLNSTKRINNSIKYVSPDFNGFSAGAMLALGESSASFAKGRIWSLGAGYGRGPLRVGAGIVVANDPNFSFWGNNPSANPESATNALNLTSRIASGYASARTQQIAAAGLAYTTTVGTVGAVYSNVRFKDLGYETARGLNPRNFNGGTATFNTMEINYAYKFTPALQVGVAYHYTVGENPIDSEDARYKQLSIGVDYALSKRTDLYSVAIRQKASGIESTGRPAAAAISSINAAAGPNQSALLVGIRHRF